MLIGELSKQSGFPRDTIRYYEKLGLISMATRTSVYKNYSLEVLERLRQIRRLKECGFTLLEIKRLLINAGDSPTCDDLPAQLISKIAKIDEKMTVLLEYKQSLLQIQQACDGACSTIDGMPDCIPRAT